MPTAKKLAENDRDLDSLPSDQTSTWPWPRPTGKAALKPSRAGTGASVAKSKPQHVTWEDNDSDAPADTSMANTSMADDSMIPCNTVEDVIEEDEEEDGIWDDLQEEDEEVTKPVVKRSRRTATLVTAGM